MSFLSDVTAKNASKYIAHDQNVTALLNQNMYITSHFINHNQS